MTKSLGGTGVGKSATVMAAAEVLNLEKPLIRFNMSSQVTIDDLLGKVIIQQNQNGCEEFIFCAQPFTVAFSEGHWLLLDELNLAQDLVLQCIETAIDTGVCFFFFLECTGNVCALLACARVNFFLFL